MFKHFHSVFINVYFVENTLRAIDWNELLTLETFTKFVQIIDLEDKKFVCYNIT